MRAAGSAISAWAVLNVAAVDLRERTQVPWAQRGANRGGLPVFSLDNPPGPQFTPAEKSTQLTRGRGLAASIAAAWRGGNRSYTIPPGDYRFSKPATFPFYQFVLEDLVNTAAAPFDLWGYGVTLWFEVDTLMAPRAENDGVWIRNCSHLRIHGITLDADPRTTIEGTVIAINPARNALQLRLSAGSLFRPFPLGSPTTNAGRFVPYKRDGAFITPLYSFQPGGGLRIANSSLSLAADRTFWITLQNTALLTQMLSPGWAKAFGDRGTLQVGDGLAILYGVGESIRIEGSDSVSVIDLNVYTAKMGPSEWGGEGGHLWQRVYLGRRPYTNQLLSGEGWMNSGLRRGSTFDSVQVWTTSDDIFNFHGYWGYINHTVPPHQIVLTPGWPIALGAGQLRAGDRVWFYSSNGTRIVETTLVGKGIVSTTLTVGADVTHLAASVVEFPDWGCGGWVVKNSYFHDVYQRAFVQSGPGIFVNNTLVRCGSSVSIRSTQLSGNEGGVPRDVSVVNNTFVNVSMTPASLFGDGVASAAVVVGRLGEAAAATYTDIHVLGNTVDGPADNAIILASVANCSVARNVFRNPVAADVAVGNPGPALRQAVFLEDATAITVANNTLEDTTGACVDDNVTHSTILGLGSCTHEVTLDGKAVGPP